MKCSFPMEKGLYLGMKTQRLLPYLLFTTCLLLLNMCKHSTQKNEGSSSVPVNKKDTVSVNSVSNLDSFLNHPFNLLIFKKKVGQSHNGGVTVDSFYFKPKTNGFYSSFFMFSHCKGYIGTNKKDTITSENGIEIITYKQFNQYKNNYIDPTEQLIAFKANFNHFELPEMAFVGLDSTIITKQLGKNYRVQNEAMMYISSNKVLILKIKFGKVKWIKYIVLNQPIKELSLEMLTD